MGRVVRKALVLAYGVHESGYREMIALDVGEAETEAFWRSFLRSLVVRCLGGVQLVWGFKTCVPAANRNFVPRAES